MAGSRYYRLSSIAECGQCVAVANDYGDLLLRPDGSFAFADFRSGYAEGRWRDSAAAVVLSPNGSQTLLAAPLAGDTLTLTLGSYGDIAAPAAGTAGAIFRFVRGGVPASSMAGTRWVLRTVDGAAATAQGGFLIAADTSSGIRNVYRILYDTLTFTDPVFFRQARAVSDTISSVGLPPSTLSPGSPTRGAYTDRGSAVVLRYGSAYLYQTDSLLVSGSTLVHRFGYVVAGLERTFEERYERLP